MAIAILFQTGYYQNIVVCTVTATVNNFDNTALEGMSVAHMEHYPTQRHCSVATAAFGHNCHRNLIDFVCRSGFVIAHGLCYN